jgi:CBS domain containing-hemolysin-like protein
MGYELLIIFALVLANGLFAGAEIAILSVRPAHLQHATRGRDRRALAVQELRDQPERFLATVQIGITVVGAAAAALAVQGSRPTSNPYSIVSAWEATRRRSHSRSSSRSSRGSRWCSASWSRSL